MGDLVAKRTQVLFFKHSFDRAVDVCDFVASRANLFVREQGDVFGLAHPWNGQLTALQAPYILLIFLGSYEFILAPAHEVEQVIKELRDFCRSHEILELQFPNAAAEIDPQIFVVDYFEVLSMPNEQIVAVRVKGLELQSRDVIAPELSSNALAHFVGRIFRVGEREDLIRTHLLVPNKVRDAADQDSRLPRSCSRHHQHGAADMLNRCTLPIVRLQWL